MTEKIFKRWVALPIILAIVLLSMPVWAQNNVQFNSLIIQIWPEFDQPETLLIYHGELADTVALPADLSFDIPAEVSDMNAVAVFGEAGNLVNHPYQLTEVDANTKQLTFSVDTPNFQFEYYDPNILQKDGKTRKINFETGFNYAITVLQVEMQEPFGAQNMVLSPSADDTAVGSDQFTYSIYRRENLTAGSSFSLGGSYTKDSDTVTTDVKVGIPQPDNTDTPSVPSEKNWSLIVGYVLVGLGIVVLLVIVGMWIYNNKKAAQADESPRRPTRKGRKSTASKSTSKHNGQAKSKFCHQCGAELQADAKFCHQCGTPRR